jgi:hypothetical protein
VEARATLHTRGDSVEITVPIELDGENTIYIHYNWTPFYVPVLYGGNDLPAVSFKSRASRLGLEE